MGLLTEELMGLLTEELMGLLIGLIRVLMGL